MDILQRRDCYPSQSWGKADGALQALAPPRGEANAYAGSCRI